MPPPKAIVNGIPIISILSDRSALPLRAEIFIRDASEKSVRTRAISAMNKNVVLSKLMLIIPMDLLPRIMPAATNIITDEIIDMLSRFDISE